MKKLLALVLALVMAMSLVTISNADFNDADEINFPEAVEVMNAVGVLAGYDNGDFGPADTLTRAQACKILAYLDLGKDVAEALPSIQVFSDVPAGNWAAKYVAYCADAGYVSGVGDGKFAPDEKVTGYQFGKMLLCVLGYDATIESMTGANWQIAVAKLMEENDIADGVSGYASANLTREQASQYALNALKATCVEYEDKGTVIEGNGLTITTGAKKAEEVVKNHDGDDCAYCSIDNDGPSNGKDYVQLGEKLYKGDLVLDDADAVDEFNRPSVTWTYDGDEVGTYAKTAKKVYVGELKANTLFNDFNLKKNTTVNIYMAGEDTDPAYTVTIADKNDKGVVVSNGAVTEAFTADGKLSELVVIPYVLGEVTDVEEADEDDEDGKRTITITYSLFVEADEEGEEGAVQSFEIKYETESFEEDDIVMFTIGYDGDDDLNGGDVVMSAELAKSVSGKITAIKGDKYTISGTAYELAALYYCDALELGDEGTFYLSVDGTIGYYTEKSSATGNYAYIYKITVDDDTVNEDGQTGDAVYTAYYVDAAGVKAKAELAVDDNTILGQAIPNAAAEGEGDDEDIFSGLYGLYEYKMTKDGMEAVDSETAEASDDLADVKIGDGYADSKTVFVFVYNKDAAAGTVLDPTAASGKIVTSVATGIKNVEKFTNNGTSDPKTVWVALDDSTVTYAFVLAAPATDDDALYAVLFDADATVSKDADDEEVYTYEVYVDGKKTTLTFDEALPNTLEDGDAFSYKMGSTYADADSVAAVTTVSGKVLKVVGDDIDVKDKGVYTIADDAVVYVVKELKNGDLKVTLGSVSKNDMIVAAKNSDGDLKFIVVDKRTAEEEA